MDRNLALEVVRVTEAAALSTARLMGKGDRDRAEAAAVDAMHAAFATVAFRGKIVIGQGKEAKKLFHGESVGCGADSSPEVDVAADPLEGTRLCASGRPNALSVVVIAAKGDLMRVPATYMEKIAVGPGAEGSIDLSLSPTDNLRRIADKKGLYIDDLTVCILDRDRHQALIEEVRESGARIKLIDDGDVSAGIATCFPRSGVDVLMGVGGAPEGIITAAAIRCVGGDFQGRLVPHDDAAEEEMKTLGLEKRIYPIDEIAPNDVMVAATGVTSGDSLRGVSYFSGGARTESVVMRSSSGTVRFIETEHHFDRKPN